MVIFHRIANQIAKYQLQFAKVHNAQLLAKNDELPKPNLLGLPTALQNNILQMLNDQEKNTLKTLSSDTYHMVHKQKLVSDRLDLSTDYTQLTQEYKKLQRESAQIVDLHNHLKDLYLAYFADKFTPQLKDVVKKGPKQTRAYLKWAGRNLDENNQFSMLDELAANKSKNGIEGFTLAQLQDFLKADLKDLNAKIDKTYSSLNANLKDEIIALATQFYKLDTETQLKDLEAQWAMTDLTVEQRAFVKSEQVKFLERVAIFNVLKISLRKLNSLESNCNKALTQTNLKLSEIHRKIRANDKNQLKHFEVDPSKSDKKTNFFQGLRALYSTFPAEGFAALGVAFPQVASVGAALGAIAGGIAGIIFGFGIGGGLGALVGLGVGAAGGAAVGALVAVILVGILAAIMFAITAIAYAVATPFVFIFDLVTNMIDVMGSGIVFVVNKISEKYNLYQAEKNSIISSDSNNAVLKQVAKVMIEPAVTEAVSKDNLDPVGVFSTLIVKSQPAGVSVVASTVIPECDVSSGPVSKPC